jgi:hypothetical protein
VRASDAPSHRNVMRWLSRRNATPGRHAAGRHSANGTPVAPSPAVPAVAAVAPASLPTPPPESGVHLGFADGSVLQLAASDPRANTFQALARTLAQGRR